MVFYLHLALLFTHFFLCSNASSSSIESLLLRGNSVNSCYFGESLLDDGECTQKLVELYFGQWISLNCPEIGIQLARLKCSGCPWDRLNDSVANYQTTFGNLDNLNMSRQEIRSILFHPARKSCSYVLLLEQFQKLSLYGSRIDLLAVILPSLANLFLSATDSRGATKTVTILGYTLPEPIYVAALLLCSNVGQGFAATSRTYYQICDSVLTAIPIWITRVVNYFLILQLIMRRALKLRTPNARNHLQSWALYKESGLETSRRKRLFIYLLCVGGPVTVQIVFLVERIGPPWLNSGAPLFIFCFLGQVQDRVRDLWYYVEASILTITIIVVSFGPPRHSTLFVIRYVILCLVVVWVLLASIMRHLPRFKVHSIGMLIPFVRSIDYNIGFAGITCTLVLAMLGLAEPLRVGWCGQRNPKVAENIDIEDGSSSSA